MTEEWREVIGFTSYSVSNLGRIRSNKTAALVALDYTKILRPNKAGSIVLRKNGKSHSLKLAQLILRAFKGEHPPGKFLARHLDDNKKNNNLSNLAWGDYQDNYDDAVRNGLVGKGSLAAIKNGDALRGRKRPDWVKQKISETKRKFPERQSYGRKHGSDGRFLGDE